MKQIRNFEEMVKAASEKRNAAIAVAAPYDKNTLHAVRDARESNLARPILFGHTERILPLMDQLSMNPANFEIHNIEETSDAVQASIDAVRTGAAHILMKGTLSTGALLKPALDKARGLNGGRLVSHLTVLDIPGFDHLLISTDGGMNIAPSLPEKADILHNAIDVARALGVETPKAAILAAVEVLNPKMQATVDAACLCKMADRGAFGNALVEGPLAMDSILSAEAAKKKQIRSAVCGQADIILSPAIETANALNKSLNYLLNSQNAGIVVGAEAPIILPSRASDPKSKYVSLALGVLLARL